MFGRLLSTLLFLVCTGILFAQTGKTIDTAQQKEKIRKMPMDTSSQPGKYKNPAQGGEHSGKTDNQKKPAKQAPQKQEPQKTEHKLEKK